MAGDFLHDVSMHDKKYMRALTRTKENDPVNETAHAQGYSFQQFFRESPLKIMREGSENF